MKVEYVCHMGDDLFVANVARVSFAKESKEFTTREMREKGSDEGIIDYLAREGHWCYDEKTEVFTDRGWKHFYNLVVEDKVAQVYGWEENNFKFSFVKPDQIHKSHYIGDMITVDQMGLNYSVTPRHKMLIDKRSSSGWKRDWHIETSDESFGKEKRIRTKALYDQQVDKDLNYWEGYFYGFILGDGSKQNKPSVVVRLKRGLKIKQLIECLGNLKKEYSVVITKEGVTEFRIKDTQALYIGKNKNLNFYECVKKGSSYCHGVFKGLLDTAGSVKRKTWTFSTSSSLLRDGFINLATYCGHNPILNKSRHFDNPAHRTNYRVMLQTKDCELVNDSRKNVGNREMLVQYDGMVYCVTVPTGMVLVRRNGKQMVCGNTPFGHPTITLRVKAPVPIRTQCFKSKIGFVENEESRRYISTTPELFIPEAFRSKPDGSIKQGSGGEHYDSNYWLDVYKNVCDNAIQTYVNMIEDGVAPEQARFILPQGCYVNWVWTGSLQAYARFCNLRKDSHAQQEVKVIADEVDKLIAPLYPYSWKALMRSK